MKYLNLLYLLIFLIIIITATNYILFNERIENYDDSLLLYNQKLKSLRCWNIPHFKGTLEDLYRESLLLKTKVRGGESGIRNDDKFLSQVCIDINGNQIPTRMYTNPCFDFNKTHICKTDIQKQQKKLKNDIITGNVFFKDNNNNNIYTFPRVIGIGPPKTGSSALWYYLGIHQDNYPIVQPSNKTKTLKELSFFTSFFNFPTSLTESRRIKELRICRWEDGLGCYLPANIPRESFWMDISPLYSFVVLSADRINMVYPDARIIMLVREPVEALWSAYHFFNKAWGIESSPELFQSLLIKKIEEYHNCVKNQGWAEYIGVDYDPLCSFNSLFLNYVYADIYLNYRSVFPRKQILVISSKELYNNTSKVMEKIEFFLGLPPGEYGDKLDNAINIATGNKLNIDDAFKERKKTDTSFNGEIPEKAIILAKKFYKSHNERLNKLVGYKVL